MAKAGLIGTGWIAELHAQTLQTLGIEISTVVGHTEEKARLFAEKWGIPSYGTDAALLYGKEVDCVHICTPTMQHSSLIKNLLEHRKHVLCEKPLCLDTEEAKQLAALAQKRACVCTVCFNVRFYLACQKAREIVCSPEFGRVLLIHGSYLQEFGVSPTQWSWRYEDKMHAVTEIGSHWLDLAQYISGRRITAISAQFDRFHPLRYQKDGHLYTEPAEDRAEISVPSEDVALLHLRFEDGAIGSVVLSELSHGRNNRLSIEITGEKQSLWWNSEDNGRLFLAQKGEACKTFLFEDDFLDTFRRLFSKVYETVDRGEATCYPSFTEGRDNVRLCDAAWQSAKENSCWVEV